MAIEKIKYKNKVAIKNDESLPEINKVTDENMNEIKKVINNNADELSLIKNQIPTGQATGNPIHIADSSNLEAKLRLNGGDKQVVTELGENILDSTEYNGIGITEDTNTGFGLSFLPLKLGEPLVPGNYSFAMFFTDGTVSGSNVSLNLYDSNNSLVTTSSSLFNFTEEQIAEIANYRIFTNTTGLELYMGKTIQGVMLVKGSTKPSVYKEFIHASPTPNNPSKVETVGSNVNLFDKDNMDVIEGAFINSSTKKIEANANRKCFYLEISPNKTYTISREKIASNFIVGTTNGVPTVGSDIIDIDFNNNETITITASNNTNYLVCYYKTKSTDVEEEIVKKIKIEEGNQATPYSPYNMGSVEIDVINKNWFKINDIEETTINGITYSIKNGLLKFNGTATGSFTIKHLGEFLNKKSNYIGSYNYIKGNCTDYGAGFYLSNNPETTSNIGGGAGFRSNQSRTFTLTKVDEDTKFYGYISINNGTVFNDYEIQIQIELGEEVTSYVEHQSQSKILPIQQEMLEGDYIEDVEHHTWKKKILNGTENWQWHNDGFCFANVNDIANTPTNIPLVKSNYFLGIEVGSNGTNYSNKDNVIFSWYSGTLICIKATEKFTNVEDAKSYLAEQYSAGTPVTVYYKLATPLDLELTEEQKEAQKINTYKNVTNIVADDELATLEVTYKKDQNTVNKNYEDRIAALEAAILS